MDIRWTFPENNTQMTQEYVKILDLIKNQENVN